MPQTVGDSLVPGLTSKLNIPPESEVFPITISKQIPQFLSTKKTLVFPVSFQKQRPGSKVHTDILSRVQTDQSTDGQGSLRYNSDSLGPPTALPGAGIPGKHPPTSSCTALPFPSLFFPPKPWLCLCLLSHQPNPKPREPLLPPHSA